jgi:hypothetical protein
MQGFPPFELSELATVLSEAALLTLRNLRIGVAGLPPHALLNTETTQSGTLCMPETDNDFLEALSCRPAS